MYAVQDTLTHYGTRGSSCLILPGLANCQMSIEPCKSFREVIRYHAAAFCLLVTLPRVGEKRLAALALRR